MSFRSKIFGLLDVILRVPPLFIIDELFRIGLSVNQDQIFNAEDATNASFNLIAEKIVNFHDTSTTHYEFYKIVLLRAILLSLGCVIATCIFMLWTRHLVVVYMYLISVAIVFVSYWANVNTIKLINIHMATNGGSVLEDILSLNLDHIVDHNGCFFTVIQSYVVQGVLAYLFVIVHLGPKYSILENFIPVSFLAPSVLGLLPLPAAVLQHAPVFSALLPLALVLFVLWINAISVLQTIYNGCLYAHNFIGNFGLDALVETEWIRLNVPCVLRTFWMLRVSQQWGAILLNMYFKSDLPIETTMSFVLSTMKSLLISGCETLTAVLGMTSIISYICHYIGCFFQWVLITEDDDDKSIGTVSAILFYILALQTGLTGLEPEKRFVRLCRNFCLLFTALLHFVHNIVNPLLMSLSASRNPSVHRHLRALLVCLFLILYPVSLLVYLWSNYAISTWLLAVSAFSIEVIVKVIVSLLIYSLFLIDAYCSTFWEKLDDYVYYIRAFGNTVEFCFGIFLFFNGAWILLFESGGAIRAGMMCIHAYFNIWSEARAGWNVFMKRRTAVNKIASLPEASDEQLNNLDDVCAICYQEMKTAKITRCNHFFHGVCLRKWLYVQDRCPLCHDILYKIEPDVRQEENINLPGAGDPEDLLLIHPLPADDLVR